MKLTDDSLAQVERRDKIYKIYDGNGLSIEVPPKGNIRWRLKYLFNKKEKQISLGVYPQTSLEEARMQRDKAKELANAGVDPQDQREKPRNTSIADDFKSMEKRLCALEDSLAIIAEGMRDLLKQIKS